MVSLVALSVAACSTATATAGPAPVPGSAPGTAALQYSRALFDGNFTAASRYVAPASRNGFLVLTDGLSPNSVKSHDLAIGSTTVKGSTAVVVITGTVCTDGGVNPSPSAKGGNSTAYNCITNTDRNSSNPVFTVNLDREADGQWMVVYLMPDTSQTAPPPATGASPVSSSLFSGYEIYHLVARGIQQDRSR